MFDCEHCGEAILPGIESYDIDCKTVCEECYESANWCDRCESSTFGDVGLVVVMMRRYESWCEDCQDKASFYCESCNCLESRETREPQYNEERDLTFCLASAEQYWTWCDSCQTWEDNDGESCGSCARGVHGYSFKPEAVFHGVGPAFFGIELETENVTGNLRGAVEVWSNFWLARSDEAEDDFYLKEDGSLSYGVEIVSHPRSLESWQEFAPTLAEALRLISDAGQRAWVRPSCGLHVHVSKFAFSGLTHQARFGLLFARNKADWIRTANRETGYASFDNLRGSVVRKAKMPWSSYHTDAVNFSPDHTVEVRIFRPSLSVARVIGSIQLVWCALEFTRGLTAHDVLNGGLEFAKFAEFVSGVGCAEASAIIAGQRFGMEIS